MKWINTEGEGSRKPEKAEQLFVKTKDGKKSTYFFTGSEISLITLREQYECWLDESVSASKETGEVKPNSTTVSIRTN